MSQAQQPSKIDLVEEIKILINTDDINIVEINPNYLDYFTLEELQEIKDELVFKKQNQNEFVEQYVQELSSKLI
jgi:hypothetical protein